MGKNELPDNTLYISRATKDFFVLPWKLNCSPISLVMHRLKAVLTARFIEVDAFTRSDIYFF